jgi:hypothetical protein
MRETSHIASCLCANIVLYACSTGTHFWSRELKSILQSFRETQKKHEKVQTNTELVNLDGKIIGYNTQYEKKIYFVELEKEWNRELK